MTLRERVETILIEVGCPNEIIGTIAGRIVALGRAAGDEITHQIGPNGKHRLIVGQEKSPWAEPTEIIRVGHLVAATDAYINLLPQVGRVFALKAPDFKTEAVQSLIK
jgi:hypothetical protein